MRLLELAKKLKNYLVGLTFHTETDQKPLIQLFTRKPVDDLTHGLQRMRHRHDEVRLHMEHASKKDFQSLSLHNFSRMNTAYVLPRRLQILSMFSCNTVPALDMSRTSVGSSRNRSRLAYLENVYYSTTGLRENRKPFWNAFKTGSLRTNSP